MADEIISPDAVEFELVIRHNVASGTFSVEGHGKNRLVALGMLEYAKSLIARENLKQAMLDDLKKRPLVSVPGGLPQ